MRPKDPHSHPRLHLAEEADEDDLMFACASCGCSSCIYYWDVEDQRAPGGMHTLRGPRWRRRGGPSPRHSGR